jgi:hypothetical protein
LDKAEILADKVRREQLTDMLERNVFWWGNRSEWGQMFQYEIIDRGLVSKGSEEEAARQIMEDRLNGNA